VSVRTGEPHVGRIAAALEGAGATAWEIYYEEDEERSVEVEDGEVDACELARSSGAAIRVLDHDRMGFAYTSDYSDAAIEATVAHARAAARATDPDPALGFVSEAEAGPTPELDVVDPTLGRRPLEEKIACARALERAAGALSPRVARVRKASYGEGRSRARLVSSLGLDRADETTLVHCDVMVVAADGNEEQLGWEAQLGHRFDELDPATCGQVAAARAVHRLGAGKVPTGRYAVVLEPQVVCELLETIAEALAGESVCKQRSMLAGKLGAQVMSPAVTLVDDGMHPCGPASGRFDGEGVARRRTVLVERGMLGAFLYDRYWARRAGASSTGNSDRSGFRVAPGVGISNLVLAPGAGGDTAALCAHMGSGLVIDEMIGVHTADPVSGEFSVGAAGRVVRGGAPAEAVAEVAVAGTLLELLSRVREVGGVVRFYGQAGAPALLVDGLDVAGSD
jgi:PmbA protein